MHKPILSTLALLFFIPFGFSQSNYPIIKNLKDLPNEPNSVKNYWLEMGTNTFGVPVLVPVIAIQGKEKGKTLGLTAAIHGNELNGIPIIHQLAENINPGKLKGRIIAIPGLNVVSMQLDKRLFIDEEDLNRNFPGKETGNESQQYAYKIKERILPAMDIIIDMHTASFGRVNAYYVRADTANDTLKKMAQLQNPDIILNSTDSPSVGNTSSSTWTLRAEASKKGIPCITVEYGDPQIFQKEIVDRGYKGILNTLSWLSMYAPANPENRKTSTVLCKKSYWLYMKEGGFLEVTVAVNQKINKGEKIAIVKDAFGKIIEEYYAPESGIIIGKSTNPINMSGGRIIHLGILE